MHSFKRTARWARLMGLTFILGLCFSTVLSAKTCNYYASPNGYGNGSQSSPFQVSNFWSVAGPGSTLCLMDGHYTGDSAMIQPPAGMSGTAANPITVSVVNDGAVLIDGEDARIPILLSNSDYFILEGMNAANSSGDTVTLNPGSDQNIVRRVAAWNANSSANAMVFSIYAGNNNLLEDVAGFGDGRKIFQTYGGATGNTIRRAWGEWNNSTAQYTAGYPKETFTLGYDSYRTTCDNCIGTKDEQVTPNPGDRYGILSMDRIEYADCDVHSGYYGSIAYVLPNSRQADSDIGLLFGGTAFNYFTFQDVAVYIAPGTHQGLTAINMQPYIPNYGNTCPSVAPGNRNLINITEVGATPQDTIDPSWGLTNVKKAGSVAGVYGSQSIWANDGTKGATVCNEFMNGALTSTPLWPWPMNQRIADATAAAGLSAVDVTATMESLFGAIPAQCRRDASVSITAPKNLRIASVSN